MRNSSLAMAAAAALALGAADARAESMFLSRQYTRCTTCHFSPTGGGLLTPYGRSLSHEELSTTGGSSANAGDAREPRFLWGALGERLPHGLSLGLEMRPSHLDVNFPGGSVTRDFFMTADLIAAYRQGNWTAYAEVGRQPRSDGAKIDSYEYWVSHQSEKGLGVRAGRFTPAYGIRLADHTAFNRAPLGLDAYDQVFGLEVSHLSDRHLFQVSVGPGRADSILDRDGTRRFTGSARLQFDLNPRNVLVVSGLLRNASDVAPRSGIAGLAYGMAPAKRVSLWTQADVEFESGTSGAPAYTLFHETAFEVYRGVWLKFSPQLRTQQGNTSAGTFRTVFELDLLPRTHWNIGVSHYRDKDRESDLVSRTWLAQLHLYL
jgi:hypothetical protein